MADLLVWEDSVAVEIAATPGDLDRFSPWFLLPVTRIDRRALIYVAMVAEATGGANWTLEAWLQDSGYQDGTDPLTAIEQIDEQSLGSPVTSAAPTELIQFNRELWTGPWVRLHVNVLNNDAGAQTGTYSFSGRIYVT